ncbi:MAG: hypothetical protein ACYDBB_25015 [Armatimonadota bacterium]
MREEPSSAMGPSDEPGEAHPRPANEAEGLGGIGTEGGPGIQESGTEPILPRDIIEPTPEDVERIIEDIAQMRPEKGSPEATGERPRPWREEEME